MKRVLLLVCLVLPLAASALDPEALTDPEQEARYRTLIAELRCLVCQNQTLADSNAPLAVDLRDEVRAQVAAGASDEEIVAWLTARYGDFVLYRPPLNAMTALLWFSPLVLLLIAAVIVVRALGARTTPPVDAAELARAQRLLAEDERE